MKSLFLVLFGLFANCLSGADAADSPKIVKVELPMAQVLDCVKRFTALDGSFTAKEIDRVSLSELNIPFLSPQIKDQTGIRVRFAPGKIKLPRPITGHADTYLRYFSVYLDAEASRVLAVTSRLEKRSPDVSHLNTLEAAAEELRGDSEFYESFPTVEPKTTFIDALQKKDGFPLVAQEIDGFYVMYSRFHVNPRPMWVINLRGLPPMSAPGRIGAPEGEEIPLWGMNHWRYLVDAITGELVLEASFPNPD